MVPGWWQVYQQIAQILWRILFGGKCAPFLISIPLYWFYLMASFVFGGLVVRSTQADRLGDHKWFMAASTSCSDESLRWRQRWNTYVLLVYLPWKYSIYGVGVVDFSVEVVSAEFQGKVSTITKVLCLYPTTTCYEAYNATSSYDLFCLETRIWTTWTPRTYPQDADSSRRREPQGRDCYLNPTFSHLLPLFNLGLGISVRHAHR